MKKIKFVDDYNNKYPEYEEMSLREISTFHKGKGLGKIALNSEGKNKCILYGELYTKYKYFAKEIFSYTNSKQGFRSCYGDVLMPASTISDSLDLIRATAVLESGVLLGGDINVIRPNLSLVDSKYLSLYINSNRRKFSRYSQGITIIHLYLLQLAEVKIPLPALDEQRKIILLFDKIEEILEKLSRKMDFLQSYNKKLRQLVFSADIRFKNKDGKNFIDWQKKELGELCSHKGGIGLEKYVDKEGCYNFISIGNYSINGQYIDDGKRILKNEHTVNKVLSKNDLVMVLNDKTTKGTLIGSTILIKEDYKYVYNQRSELIRCKEEVSPTFLWYLLNSKDVRNRIYKLSQGSTQIYVNFLHVKKLLLWLPSLEEQKCIIDFFRILDNKVEKLKKQIESFEKFKIGLLRHIFI